MKEKIISNKIQCKHCEDIIESTHVHDFKWCSCKTVFVDGGREYRRLGFKNSFEEDIIDLSVVEYFKLKI